LAASVFVVLHVHPEHISHVPELLAARSSLPARHPLQGEKVEPGTMPGVSDKIASRERGDLTQRFAEKARTHRRGSPPRADAGRL
jgi:hypothetical protein